MPTFFDRKMKISESYLHSSNPKKCQYTKLKLDGKIVKKLEGKLKGFLKMKENICMKLKKEKRLSQNPELSKKSNFKIKSTKPSLYSTIGRRKFRLETNIWTKRIELFFLIFN